MLWIGFGIAGVVAIGLVFIGGRFLLQPRAAARAFGIPDSELTAHNPFWAVKGVRDLGVALLIGVLVLGGSAHLLAWGLLLGALIPIGDCLIVLRSGGTRLAAVGIHGLTAAVLLAAAALLFVAH
ncbi:MAG: DUF4267 domain-containing protein [Candidatus Dormibacteraceae bacterium]